MSQNKTYPKRAEGIILSLTSCAESFACAHQERQCQARKKYRGALERYGGSWPAAAKLKPFGQAMIFHLAVRAKPLQAGSRQRDQCVTKFQTSTFFARRDLERLLVDWVPERAWQHWERACAAGFAPEGRLSLAVQPGGQPVSAKVSQPGCGIQRLRRC